ncbi:spore gernimation protein [Ornithinibacillus gellani]|nr:spore gernimation protein [Ornithinibacillus gellani]
MRGALYLLITIGLAVVLTGCFKGEQSMEEMDPPQNAEAVDQSGVQEEDNDATVEENTEEVDEDGNTAVKETVARQLYLLDVNGMIAPQTLELPKPESNEVAKQVLEYLIVGGPVTAMLPNGFQAVLPEGTEVLGLSLQEDGTMVVDLSEEFKEYEADQEKKILEAMTFTLTQFENVDRIKLWINGHPLEEMPVDGTPVSNGYSKANGINLMKSDAVDLMESEAVTMYYPAEHNEKRYYVPITRHVQMKEEDVFQSIVSALIEGPGYDSNLIHVFNADAQLVNQPSLNDGVLELTFNEGILKADGEAVIADEVMETLVRTLTEQDLVDAIDIQVNNVDEITNENGEIYNEPVARKKFVPVEQL